MEFPEPIKPETIEPELSKENEIINYHRQYELKLNDELYNLIIYTISKNIIVFKMRQSHFISFTFYYAEYKYDDLLNQLTLEKNNYKDVNKLLELFDVLIKNNDINVHKETKKNNIALYLRINENSKIKEHCLYLKNKTMNEKEMINILINEVNQIKNKENLRDNNIDNNKKSEKEDDVNAMEKELKRLDEEIVKMNRKKEELKNKLNLLKSGQNLKNSEKNKLTEKERKNEIELQIQINEANVDTKVFFLNCEVDDSKNIPKNTELNKDNIDLFINNIKYDFRKSFFFHKTGLYNIKLIFKKNIKNCSYLFSNCINIKYINLFYFNTNDVVDMKGMFYGCSNLEDINLSLLKTDKTTDMSEMFYGCNNLKYLNLTSFNTLNTKTMKSMFYRCYNLESVDLSSFNCQNTKNLTDIFCDCYNLKNIKISYNSLDIFNYASDEIIETVEI